MTEQRDFVGEMTDRELEEHFDFEGGHIRLLLRHKPDATWFHKKALAILNYALTGILTTDNFSWDKTDWDWDTGVKFVVAPYWGGLSSYDFAELTRLVFAAHEYGIRVQILPYSQKSLAISMHKRDRGTEPCKRHPTLDQSIGDWKGRLSPGIYEYVRQCFELTK
ncbi:MAG: hypothetical protein LUC93_18315 [Planctomycetaceae bacterium]|nr:hypothetical protein [Planctomycetaceae bacterium]